MSDNQKHQDATEFRALEFVKNNLNSAECYGVSDKQHLRRVHRNYKTR